MIVNTKRNDVVIHGDVQGLQNMHLNADGQSHLIRLLTRAYSDQIGSLIRESVFKQN